LKPFEPHPDPGSPEKKQPEEGGWPHPGMAGGILEIVERGIPNIFLREAEEQEVEFVAFE
jgi:hypothetical protein